VITRDVEEAVTAIRAGRVVAVPTDTVYGLACDPASTSAVDAIYAIKDRPAELELTLLAASLPQLERLVDVSATARLLAEAFWPGGLSIVMPARGGLAVPRHGSTLSARVPAHDLTRAVLERTGPLATTSANRHGLAPAVTAIDAEATLGSAVALVLDGGTAGGVASTIIDCTTNPPRVLREGPIHSHVLFTRLGREA